MKLLLDTHAFLFAAADPGQLGGNVRRLLVSLWEIALKALGGKLQVDGGSAFLERQLQALGAEVLDLGYWPSLRLLIAQAQVERMVLAARDGAMAEYGVRTVW